MNITPENYSYKKVCEKREEILLEIQKSLIGGKELPKLTKKEKEISKILFKLKEEIIKNYKNQEEEYIMKKNFNTYRKVIEKTKLYKLIQKFPKGFLLHTHFIITVMNKWVVKNVMYRDDCYKYIGKGEYKVHKSMEHLTVGNGEFLIVDPKKVKKTPKDFLNVNEMRKKFGDDKKFDEQILESFVITDNDEHGSTATRWINFQDTINRYKALIFFDEVFEDYFDEMFRVYYKDNIQGLELNSPLGEIYNHDKVYTPEEHLNLFIKLDKKYRKKYKDWCGIKIVNESVKFFTLDIIKKDLESYIYLQNKYPEFVVGFDLVGEEDKGKTTFSLMEILCEAKEKAIKNGKKFNFIFHAGESNWENLNILDALLLDAKRIGHGVNLYKYPQFILDILVKKKTHIVVCPISNFLLGYVADQRLHPVQYYMNKGIPICFSNDDTGVMNYEGVSHDFFVVTMCYLSECFSDNIILGLKQIAKNSILYSFRNDDEKKIALKVWEKKYNEFLDSFK